MLCAYQIIFVEPDRLGGFCSASRLIFKRYAQGYLYRKFLRGMLCICHHFCLKRTSGIILNPAEASPLGFIYTIKKQRKVNSFAFYCAPSKNEVVLDSDTVSKA